MWSNCHHSALIASDDCKFQDSRILLAQNIEIVWSVSRPLKMWKLNNTSPGMDVWVTTIVPIPSHIFSLFWYTSVDGRVSGTKCRNSFTANFCHKMQLRDRSGGRLGKSKSLISRRYYKPVSICGNGRRKRAHRQRLWFCLAFEFHLAPFSIHNGPLDGVKDFWIVNGSRSEAIWKVNLSLQTMRRHRQWNVAGFSNQPWKRLPRMLRLNMSSVSIKNLLIRFQCRVNLHGQLKNDAIKR